MHIEQPAVDSKNLRNAADIVVSLHHTPEGALLYTLVKETAGQFGKEMILIPLQQQVTENK